ncbi:uncharacterized protein V1516DRAFT_679431 [Lipomyces oligophaga]|uniref:uncharacterized protein n=1 Tax=Lipomyces oligophaga TaxID=45792 RepID=UPI0034CD2D27
MFDLFSLKRKAISRDSSSPSNSGGSQQNTPPRAQGPQGPKRRRLMEAFNSQVSPLPVPPAFTPPALVSSNTAIQSEQCTIPSNLITQATRQSDPSVSVFDIYSLSRAVSNFSKYSSYPSKQFSKHVQEWPTSSYPPPAPNTPSVAPCSPYPTSSTSNLDNLESSPRPPRYLPSDRPSQSETIMFPRYGDGHDIHVNHMSDSQSGSTLPPSVRPFVLPQPRYSPAHSRPPPDKPYIGPPPPVNGWTNLNLPIWYKESPVDNFNHPSGARSAEPFSTHSQPPSHSSIHPYYPYCAPIPDQQPYSPQAPLSTSSPQTLSSQQFCTQPPPPPPPPSQPLTAFHSYPSNMTLSQRNSTPGASLYSSYIPASADSRSQDVYNYPSHGHLSPSAISHNGVQPNSYYHPKHIQDQRPKIESDHRGQVYDSYGSRSSQTPPSTLGMSKPIGLVQNKVEIMYNRDSIDSQLFSTPGPHSRVESESQRSESADFSSTPRSNQSKSKYVLEDSQHCDSPLFGSPSSSSRNDCLLGNNSAQQLVNQDLSEDIAPDESGPAAGERCSKCGIQAVMLVEYTKVKDELTVKKKQWETYFEQDNATKVESKQRIDDLTSSIQKKDGQIQDLTLQMEIQKKKIIELERHLERLQHELGDKSLTQSGVESPPATTESSASPHNSEVNFDKLPKIESDEEGNNESEMQQSLQSIEPSAEKSIESKEQREIPINPIEMCKTNQCESMDVRTPVSQELAVSTSEIELLETARTEVLKSEEHERLVSEFSPMGRRIFTRSSTRASNSPGISVENSRAEVSINAVDNAFILKTSRVVDSVAFRQHTEFSSRSPFPLFEGESASMVSLTRNEGKANANNNALRPGRKARTKSLFDGSNLRSLHVHRTALTSKHFDRETASKIIDEGGPFGLVPKNVVPVIKDSTLGFREGAVDPRTHRLRRGLPVYKIGRKGGLYL